MTSSDRTDLSPGAIERVAGQVGASHVGLPGAVGAAGSAGAGSAASARIALVCAKFNGAVTERLLEGALAALAEHGLAPDAVEVAWVPGAFEAPVVAAQYAHSDRVDAVVALGAVIRGDTAHFDFVAGQCAAGLQQVAVESGVPVVFGVLTTDTVEQALERSEKGADNKGYESAITALEMVDLLSKLPARPR